MSVSGIGGSEPSGKALSQDFDLNLAPIIDAFTVLIAFVMISTAFASIGILDAGVAAGGDTPLSKEVPPVRIAVEVQPEHRFLVKLTGKENRDLRVSDEAALRKQLDEIRKRWPTVQGAVVSAQNSVPYDEVVQTMDQVRKTFPAVMVGGL